MIKRWKWATLAVAGLAGASMAAFPIASQAQTEPATANTTLAADSLVSYPVTFTVKNVDDATAIATVPGDGHTYQVKGHITAPAGALGAPSRAVTLYTEGLGYGEWFWRFTAVPGYNFAQIEAKAGLTSVTINGLGYGDSGIPNGDDVGYGTTASVDHQIVEELRSGDYQVDGASPVTFGKVALGASTQGVFSAELEEYTFHDVNAVVMTGFADEGFSPSLLANYGINVTDCVVDPLPEAGPGSPPNYQYRERTPAMFAGDDLTDTAAAVRTAATALHSKDPCGFPVTSVLPTVAENNLFGATINVPILSVFGADDPDFIVPVATSFQKVEFALNPDATVVTMANTNQDVTLGTTSPQFDSLVASWLTKHGYATS